MVHVERERVRRLSRDAWVRAALEAIAEGGLAAVAVVPLAERLGVTKGSFYWHFRSRETLVEAALADWEESHTAAVIAEIEAASTDPREQLRLLIKRVSTLAAGDRVELALLATADHRPSSPRSTVSHAVGWTSSPNCSNGLASRARMHAGARSSPTPAISAMRRPSMPRPRSC